MIQTRSFSSLLLFLPLITNQALSQGEQALPHETKTDHYIPVARETMARSPAYIFSGPGFSVVQVNVDSLGMNILGDAANEPSIAVHPVDPDKLAIGWRQFDTIASNFRQAGYGYSNDGGLSWTFPGVLEPGVFRSDPVLGADTEGRFFYYSLATEPDYYCTLFADTTGGGNWDGGTYAYGGDKAWMGIDRTEGIGRDQLYFAWDWAGCCGDDWFTRSTSGGTSFDPPVPVPDEPVWGVTTVGPDGSVYVAGRRSSTNQAFIVAKSSTVQDSSAALGFDFAVQVDMGGDHEFSIGIGPNPGGLQGQVWIDADHSNGPYAGYIYVLCSVNPPGTDPLDVHFVRSTDGGTTWSAPVRVNDDSSTTAWQWFGTMSVAPGGRIDVIWLDTRNGPDVHSALFYSYSFDGGESWSENEQLSDSFDPHLGWPNQSKLGDYFDMVSLDEGAHLAWAATFNGEQDVYYSWIEAPVTSAIGASPESPDHFVLMQNYPNPFNAISTFELRVANLSDVHLVIYNVLGQEVTTLMNERLTPGIYRRQWDAGALPSGLYFYRLTAGNFTETKKLVLQK